MKTIPLLLALSVLAASESVPAATGQVFSPAGAGNLTSYPGPFLWFTNQAPSIRYQQVYGSSDFNLFLGPGSGQITQISFDTGAGALNVTLPNVQISLSTTARAPDGLSTTFSDNVGADSTVVFSGALHLSSSGLGSYEVRIPLQQSFNYDWRAGNLLLDVRNFQTIVPQPTVLFNAAGVVGDSSSLAIAFDVNSPTAQLGSGALLTEFTVVVPEPRSVALFALSLAGLCGLAWRRRASVENGNGGFSHSPRGSERSGRCR